jgi:predicted secreted protein
MEVVYDSAHASNATYGDAFRPDADGALYVEFYPSTASGEKYTGQVLVTSVSRSASFDDLITASVSFQGTGVLDIESV